MADILRCPARGSALGRPSTPTLSVSTFREAPRGGGWPRQELLDFAGLEKGLLFVAEQRISDVFSFIWTLFTKRHLQGKLKFDAIESQELFCKFLAYTWAHTFVKFSGVCRQKVLGRHVHPEPWFEPSRWEADICLDTGA